MPVWNVCNFCHVFKEVTVVIIWNIISWLKSMGTKFYVYCHIIAISTSLNWSAPELSDDDLFHLWLLSFCTLSILQYCEKNTMFQKLDLFLSSCERVGRHLLSWVHEYLVQWIRLALTDGTQLSKCLHTLQFKSDLGCTLNKISSI
jgi:hypothetical protein